MYRWTQRLIYEVLRSLDAVFPGWSAPKADHADYLSKESYSYWMHRHYHKGDLS